MADLYVSNMRDALKNFHKDVLTTYYNAYVNHFGSSPSDNFYEALAWQGLKNRNISAYDDLTQAKKDSIAVEEQKLGLLKQDCPNTL